MARPSLKTQRVGEILDALEICILRDGLSSTSLESLAEQAGMKRSILRHYIGNRDDIIIALANRWNEQLETEWQQLLFSLPDKQPMNRLIDALFYSKNAKDIDHYIVGEALFAEAKRLPELKHLISAWTLSLIDSINEQLSKAFPNAKSRQCRDVAHGIFGIYSTAESYTPIFPEQSMTKYYKAAAIQLLNSLA